VLTQLASGQFLEIHPLQRRAQEMLVSIAEQLERWAAEARERRAFSPSMVGGDDALDTDAQGEDMAAAEALRERLAAIRAAGPGATALLAAEDADLRAALFRRHEARQRSQGGGWTHRLGWFIAPLVPCVISLLVAQYGSPSAAGTGLVGLFGSGE